MGVRDGMEICALGWAAESASARATIPTRPVEDAMSATLLDVSLGCHRATGEHVSVLSRLERGARVARSASVCTLGGSMVQGR